MPVVQPPPWVALVVDMEGLQDHNAHLIRQPNHASLDVFDMPYRTAHLLQLIRHIQASPREGVEVWVSEREAKDEELVRGGATSRRYLAHCKRLSKLMLKLQRAHSAGSGETDEHVCWFKWLDDDETSVVTATSMAFARRAVGAALTAVDAIWSGEAQHAFVLCRPPGHHNGSNEALEVAERDSFRFASHGGCLFNETAVAIHHLRHLHVRPRRTGGESVAGLRTQLERSGENPRAAVLDLDVHFGDGTAWQFYDDASVLTVSVHLDQSEAGQFPYLKGSARERGDGDGRGTWMWAGSIGVVGRYGWAFIASAWGVQSFAVHPFAVGIESLWELITRACVARNHWTKQGANINLPIKEGMGDAHAWALLQQCAFPAIQAHAPHVLFVAFGTDGLRGDPTEAGICYTPALFAAVLRWCRSACSHVLVTLQGGYQSQPLATAIDAALRALCHEEVDGGTSAPDVEGMAMGERGDHDRAHVQAYVDMVRSQLDADDRWWSWEDSFAYCVDSSGGAMEEGNAHEQGLGAA